MQNNPCNKTLWFSETVQETMAVGYERTNCSSREIMTTGEIDKKSNT